MPIDYYPDIEKPRGNRPQAQASQAQSRGVSIDDVRRQWLADWNDPATIQDIRDWMKNADRLHWQLVDKIGQDQDRYPGRDTPEERNFLESYSKLDHAIKGLTVLVDKGFGSVVWTSSEDRYKKIQDVGNDYFKAASAWISSKPPTLSEKLKVPNVSDSSWGWWKGAIAVTLGIVAIGQFTDLVKTVRNKD